MSDLRPGTTMGRIAELEQRTRDLRQETRELRAELAGALQRIRQMEAGTPESRQAQYEADVALADLAASGYDDDGPDPGDDPPCPETSADGMVTITGPVTLEATQAATVLGALEDAETARRRCAEAFCHDCNEHPAGACEDHLSDLDAAQQYHELAARLLGGGAR